jgi:LacI family transcriptional regulator
MERNVATIRDVADLAGVSVGTVSRVLNNHPKVSSKLREDVLSAIDTLQFKPNTIARNLRTSRTHTVGLNLSDLRSSLLAQTGVWSVESLARERDYDVLVTDSHFSEDLETRHIRTLIERRVDGLLVAPVSSSRRIYELVRDSGVPTVIFGWITANPLLPTAVMSETEAMRAAAEHLAELGHSRISILGYAGPLGTGGPIRQRLLRQELDRVGGADGARYDRLVAARRDYDRVVVELLRLDDRPTAIVLSSGLARPLMTALREEHLSVPDDISLIVFSDPEWTEIVTPPMNAIALDYGAHLKAAGELLFGLIDHKPSLPHFIGHQARYIKRASVARAPR